MMDIRIIPPRSPGMPGLPWLVRSPPAEHFSPRIGAADFRSIQLAEHTFQLRAAFLQRFDALGEQGAQESQQ